MAVRLRPVAINVLVGDEQPSYSFDLAGRLIGAFVDGYNYRRALDGRVLRKWPGAQGASVGGWQPTRRAGFRGGSVCAGRSGGALSLSDRRLDVLTGLDAPSGWPRTRASSVASIARSASCRPTNTWRW